MARLLRGAPLAKEMAGELSLRAAKLAARGCAPTLEVVRVGADPSDLSYERSLVKRAATVGVKVVSSALPGSASEERVRGEILRAGADGSVHGVMVFRPLPRGIDGDRVARAIDPSKDVDGITPASLYGVFSGSGTGFAPCTAEAVVELLTRSGIALEGARVTVVGRSLVVGRPLAALLLARDATVTVCHTRTRDVASCCREADIVIAATGHPGTVGADAVRAGQTVVDVGTTWSEAEGRLVGDVAFDDVEPVVDAITPVPGGVGALTTTVLMRHVIEAAEACGPEGAAHGASAARIALS